MDLEADRLRSPPSTVMASIDRDEIGDRFIIADVSRDEAWISIPSAESLSLSRWR